MSDTKRTLDSAPGSLPLFGRAALGAVPGAGKLPFVAGGGGDVPDLELELANVAVDAGHLADYCRVCGFGLGDELPVTYPHILAFPLHMALLTDSSFPFPAIGLVHVANRITQRRPIALGEELQISVRATKLEPHPKGKTFTIRTEVRASGEAVWSGESQNLRRGKGDESAKKESSVAAPELRDEAEWALPGDLGRRYAAVSGDRNPIHMYGVTAKAFGFPRQIAHGMWTKARCLAQLGPRLPGAVDVEVAFKRPILLPSKVRFASAESGARVDFGVRSARDDTPHLAGSVTPV